MATMTRPGRIWSGTDFKHNNKKQLDKGIDVKLHFSEKDCETSFANLPHQIVLFVDTDRHIVAHAIKGPNFRYCAYIECPDSLSPFVNDLTRVSWPISGHGSALYLPAGVPKAFQDTVIVGWDYDHPEYPKTDHDWNNLNTVMEDCLKIYSIMIGLDIGPNRLHTRAA